MLSLEEILVNNKRLVDNIGYERKEVKIYLQLKKDAGGWQVS
jgi:hypothetical protein